MPKSNSQNKNFENKEDYKEVLQSYKEAESEDGFDNIFAVGPPIEKIQDYETPVLKDWLNYNHSNVHLVMQNI